MLYFFKKFYCFFFIIFFCFSLVFVLSSCKTAESDTLKNKKISVVASLFPQYDFAQQVAGDRAEISLLLPPGTESHSYDPRPADILKISNCDVFIYTGQEMEPWADKLINSVNKSELVVCDASNGINLIKNESHHEKNEEIYEKIHEHNFDPHVWLDPTLAAKMVDNIYLAFCKKYPLSSEYFKNNAENYKSKLFELDHKFKSMIDSSKRKAIVFAGRFAHLYFVKRYNLQYISAFNSCSAEAEPSVKKISEIISFINKNHIPVIYYEELSEPKIAKSITEQTRAKPLKFSTIHNVTKNQLQNNFTYIDLMLENYENLKQGLN